MRKEGKKAKESSKGSLNALPPNHAISNKVSISSSNFMNVPYSL